MSPKYNDGEFVILQRIDPESVVSGMDYYVEVANGEHDGGGTLKQLVILGNSKILLIPINGGSHRPIEINADDILLVRRAIGKYCSFTDGRFGAA